MPTIPALGTGLVPLLIVVSSASARHLVCQTSNSTCTVIKCQSQSVVSFEDLNKAKEYRNTGGLQIHGWKYTNR